MKVYLFSFSLLFISLLSFAQQGTIRVSVYDDETGETLIGANVVIKGTTTGAVTDLDGKASINNLESGNYNLLVSFVSYQGQVIQNVEVTEKNPVVLNVRLKTENIGLDEVVVEAQAIRNSESALLTVQRKSMLVMDAISSEQFSRNGDSDAASAIRRVTGVSIEGGKYVYVRGLGDRYSKTNLNGASVPGLDPNRNAVQLDIFPSNLVDNIIVYKTFSPELPGDFTGGLVDIVTKDFPDRFTFQLSSSLGYNSQATNNSNFLTTSKSSTDILGFDNGLREMPEELKAYNSTNFPRPYTDNQELDRVTKSFDNVDLDNRTTTPAPNHSLSLSLGNQHKVFKNSTLGYIGAASYSRDFEYYNSGFVGRYSAGAGADQLIPESLLNDERGTESVLASGMFNASLKINHYNKIKVNTLFNQSGTNSSRNQSGLRARPDINENRRFESRALGYLERSMKNFQVAGEHTIPAINNLSIKWLSSYTLSNQEEPDLRFFANNINIQPDESIRYGFDAATSRRPSRYFRNLDEDNFDSHLDFTLPLKVWSGLEAKVKFGGAYTTKERTFREDRLEYFLSNTIRFEDNVEEFLSDSNLGIRQDNGSLGHYLSNVTELRNNYDAEQEVYAGYLATELPIVKNIKFNGGLRIETTDISIKSFDGTEGGITEVDLLPAAGLTYEVITNMNIRTSYTKTLARPTFREIAPLATFDFVGDFFQLGNPELKRTIVDNIDLRWEFYPSPEEYLSVSGFYKNFKDPIENTIVPKSGSTDGEFKFNNVDQAVLYGLELEARKSLKFISPVLSNFKIGANVTFVSSEVDINEEELQSLRVFVPDAKSTRAMYNQSPYIINAALVYNNAAHRFLANLTYNVFGERLSYVATNLPYVYEQSRPELNFSVAKSLGKRIGLKFNASNLLNPDFKQTMTLNDKEYVFQSYNWGRSFSVGFSYLID